ncbi:uncharacterized protein LOC129952414 isoform X2 [Eupeodes corollae]|uniref:uncharacterized protein LOC129952414 isoform X2 n=1 Tax=Eupeodes corollae TaxID=290404 RepID=UPI002492D24E|nr:uncharacterized protein LOC129952414 isoform X2 [Eupeodes corollae]
MSKKMWNRIFKTKSTNKTPGISKKTPMTTAPTFSSAVENRLSYYEEFHNCCQQQHSPIKENPMHEPTATTSQSSSSKSQSKFSKVVNTLTLKRNNKENQKIIQSNTTLIVAGCGDTNYKNGSNNSNEETIACPPIIDKICTPTQTTLKQISDYTIEQNEEPISLELIPCPTCSRTFIQQTLEKHVKICEKMTIRKRKIFDSSRQRREGTELAAYPLPKNYGLPAVKNERGISPKPIQAAPPILSPKKPPEEPSKTSTNLKCVTPITSKKPLSPSKATNNLLVTSSNLSAAPKERSRPAMITKRIQPPPAEQCPYCERCFGIKAYDRHVEWCKEKALLASIKNNSSNSQVAAKERLEARIKYKAPCLKTKRAVNRDKYSYQNDEHFDMQSSMNENHQTALMTSSMTSSCMSDILIAPKNLNPHTIKKKMPLKDSKNLTKFPKEDRVKAVKIISTDSYLRNDVKLQQLSKKDFQRDLSIDPTMLHVYKQASNKDLKSPMTKIKGKDNGSSIIAQRENLSKSKMSSSNGRDIIKESVEVVSFDSSSNRSVYQVPGRLPKNQSFIVSAVSDDYDPFISAKRQLEELCSPSSPGEGRLSPSCSVASCKTPPTLQFSRSSSKMTTSFTSRGSLTNPRSLATTPKSNFHRTSSLRAPRRSPLPMSSRPIFFPSSQKQRPTIQRGLSDEGPISSNFLKPEEYDEMPVRAVCVNDFAISNTPRVIRRDSSAACNRKTLRLNLLDGTQSRKNGSPTLSNNNLLKTDSLAVFLKYENEAKGVINSVANTKELKDKNNALSKQNSAKNINSTDDLALVNLHSDISQQTDNLSKSKGNLSTLKLEPLVRPQTLNTKKTSRSVLSSTFDKVADSDYIDPKLINICDNLPMELGNDLESNSSSPPSFSSVDRNNCDPKKLDLYENTDQFSRSSNSSLNQLKTKKDLLPQMAPIIKSCTNSNRSSSGDNRNQLKRKIRLGRNQFLYDASPEALDNDADDEANNRSSCDHDTKKPLEQKSVYTSLTHATVDTASNIPPFSPSTFNEFDFEEFLSTFDNDREQFPSLFKDCREFLMNRSTLNKRTNVDNIMSSSRSTKETTENSSQKYQQEVELNLDSDENKNRGEIFISIETDQNENDPHPKNDPIVAANPSAQIEEVKIDDNKFQKIEDGETEGDAPNRVVDEESDSQLRMRRISLLNDFPNVKLNNAKNLIQQMHEDFQGLHASAAADGEEDFNCGNLHQITGRSLHPADSDEISSIEYYPVHRGGKGQSGGRNCGVIKSKQSADSAYGSLSRQSPTREINSNYHSNASYRATPISAPQDLPKTGQSTFQYPTIKPHKYKNNPDVQNYRCRNFSADSSSSGSENSLSPVNGSKHVSSVKEQQSQVQEFNLGFQRNPLSTSTLEKKHKSTKSTGSISNSSSTNNLPTPNVKTSKFCHECGSKFLLDQAKFCMDCGTPR